jgi:hypothetical protein
MAELLERMAEGWRRVVAGLYRPPDAPAGNRGLYRLPDIDMFE